MDNKKPWERQFRETSKQFEAFSIYLTMGKNRTQKEVARTLGKSDGYISEVANKRNWDERVRAYDSHVLELELQAKEAQKKAVEERNRNIVERQIRLGSKIMEMCEEAMDNFIHSHDLKPTDLAKLVQVAHKMELVNIEKPTERIEQTGEVQVEVKASVDPESVKKLIENPTTRQALIDLHRAMRGQGEKK